MSLLRVGRWMSRAEYDAMAMADRMQPTLDGREMKHVTAPPDRSSFRAAEAGSVFVEFDTVDAQMATGGKQGWYIVYGPNSFHGRNATRNGRAVAALPDVKNVIIMETK